MKKAGQEAAQSVPPVDEFHGMGGSYVIDPKTGKRTLVERTLSMDEAASAAEGERDGTA